MTPDQATQALADADGLFVVILAFAVIGCLALGVIVGRAVMR